MKIRTLSFAFALLAIMTALISCADKNPTPTGKPQSLMHPTDEYNYMLTPKYWNEQAADIAGMAQNTEAKIDLNATINKGGYGEPKIAGQTDGEKILLTGTYPVLKDKKDYSSIFSKLPNSKVGFSGRIPPDKLIAYVKLPGLQGIFDTVHDYYQLLIDKGETKSKSNPVTQLTGLLMMARVDIQEDVFSWMGPEIGLIMYKATDRDKEEYLNTAFVMSIKDKAKAQEKLAMLLKLAGGFEGQKPDKEWLKRETYKSYDMDLLDTTGVDLSRLGIPPDQGKSGENLPGGILYTDDYLFISDTYGLKQLADIYNPGGAPGDVSTMAAYIDWDALMKYSTRYQNDEVKKIRKQFEGKPENLAKFEENYNKFVKMSQGKTYGKSKVLVNVAQDGLKIDMETTKSVVELMNFINEWFKESMKTEEKPIETSKKKEEAKG